METQADPIHVERSGRAVLVSGPARAPLPEKAHSWLLDKLTYYEKKFDFAGGTGMDYIDRRLYQAGPGARTLIIPLGLLTRTIRGLREIGHPVYNKSKTLTQSANPETAGYLDWDALFRDFKIYPDQQDCLSKIIASDGGIISAPTGTGKAQPLSSTVITPTGPKRMGDIRIGDKVCHPNGGTSTVIAIHPQGEVPIYKVTFADKTVVRCCGNHLWSIRDRGRAANPQLRTTLQIIERIGRKGPGDHYIPTPAPVYFEPRLIPMPAYTLGVLLGDGSITQRVVRWCKPDPLIAAAVSSELPPTLRVNPSKDGGDWIIGAADGHRTRFMASHETDWHAYRKALADLGLWGHGSLDKFIPDDYLYNSEEVRWEILRGLMDTDGSVEAGGKVCTYSTSSPRLADGFEFLVSSLGGTATRRIKKTTHADSHQFYVKFSERTQMFKVATKKDRVRPYTTYKETLRKIREVVADGVEEAQCITVDAADGMYLTEQCIPTHNSVILRMLGVLYSKAKIHIVAKSATLVDEIFNDLVTVIPSVGRCGGGYRDLRRVTVFIADSLHHGEAKADIVLCDEIHELVAPKYAEKLGRYTLARIFGFSASPTGRQDGRDIVGESLCGPTLHTMTYQEAEGAGRVVPITVEWLRMPHGPDSSHISNIPTREKVAIWTNDYRNSVIASRAFETEPDEQVMIMVKTIDHAVRLKKLLPHFELVYAGNGMDARRLAGYIRAGLLPADEPLMTPKRLSEMRRQFAAGELKKVISNYVWSTGVNFRNLAVLIRADAAASEIRDVQIPGRICRRIPGAKESALLIDCYDDWDQGFHRRAQNRWRNYQKKGWNQIFSQSTVTSEVLT